MYSGDFREIGVLKARFDASYRAVFYIQAYLRAQLSYQLPATLDNSTLIAEGLCKRYIAAFDTVTPPELETLDIAAESKYVLLAGFDFHRLPNRAGLLLPEGKQLLTARPLSRKITEAQYEYLYYLVRNEATTVSLEVTVFYTDGSTQQQPTEEIGTYQKYQVLAIPIGYQARGYHNLDPEKTIASLRVNLQASGENTLSVKLSPFQPGHSYSKEFYYFSPSMGGLETLVTTGKATQTDHYQRRVAERQVPYDYSPSFAAIESLETQRKPIFKQSIGFHAISAYRAYMEFLAAEKQYIRIGDELLPIIVTDSKKTVLDDQVFIYAYEFTYYIAQPQL
jgi:hypothetical protein